jgi:hypothetical protein
MEVRIKVKFKSVELELSLEEAKELAQILGGFTHKDEVRYPWYPVYVEPWRPWSWPWTTWTVTSGDTTEATGTAVYNVTAKGVT